jgi:predicted GNAT family acetyltransferase
MTSEHTDVRLQRDDARHRYEAYLGDQLAGYLGYREREDEVALIHTETLAGFEGRGVGSALARYALEDVRSRGVRAVALCPFVRSWLARHPEYNDVVAHAK